ncbi:MAG: hypothetical protein RLZZ451_1870 [Pseudomonadota bacterium]
MSRSTSPDTPDMDPQALRRRAAARLGGPAAAAQPATGIVDALSVLHTLASSPATAPDALALLHELQVHQVELDLQAQELQESRAELESALRQQAERHDAWPVGCLVVDAGGVVVELNETAARLLGLPQGQAPGQRLGAFLAGHDRLRFEAALAGLRGEQPPPSFRLVIDPPGQAPRPVLASLGRDTATGGALLCLLPAETVA